MAQVGAGLTADDPRAIQQLFDGVAPTYDLLNRILSLGTDRRMRRRAARLLTPEPGGAIADICGGTGDLALAVAESHPECRVLLFDFAEEMLRVGAPKIAGHALGGRIDLAAGDACRLPLPDASCEGVTAGFGFRNLKSVRAGLLEAHRVLKTGGRLGLVEFFRPEGLLAPVKSLALHTVVPVVAWCIAPSRAGAYAYLAGSISRFLSTSEMVALLRDTGFDDIEVHTMMMGVITIMGATKA